jgi:hypothetical protein
MGWYIMLQYDLSKGLSRKALLYTSPLVCFMFSLCDRCRRAEPPSHLVRGLLAKILGDVISAHWSRFYSHRYR